MRRGAAIASAAAAIGLAAGLPMLLLLPHAWQVTLPAQEDAGLYLFTRAPVPLALLAAGGAYGLLAQALTGRGSRVLAALAGGLTFPVGVYGAAQESEGVLNWTILPLAGALAEWAAWSDATWFSVATTFGAAAGCVAFALTAAVGLAARARGALRCAGVVAVATFAIYVAVGASLEPLPGWAMERGNGAMPKVTAVCALAAGGLGGALWLWLIARGGGIATDGSS
jgi:hypothetical protein